PSAYLDAGHLTHGYAMTVHKAQGLTADRAFLFGTDQLYFELGYVGLSRGRITNHLYVVASDHDNAERGTSTDRCAPDDELRRALSTSRAQRLAVDQLDPPDSLGALVRERNLLRLTLPRVGPDPRPSVAAAEKRVVEAKARLTEEQACLEHAV